MADATSPRPRWQRWALVASLGLNLAFVGLIAGAAFRGPPPPPMPGLWNYARLLPEPHRRDLGRALRESRRDWIGPREALRGQRQAMAAVLSAEPFDAAAVAELLERQSALLDELSSRGSAMLAAEISKMTPEERVAYAEALRNAPDRPPRPPKPR